MAKFFVSYSRTVKDEVGKVVALLRASGHEVWWDGDIPIMADWWATILKHIEWCEVFIFVTSEKAVESAYCLAELKYANDRQRPILPFIMDDPSGYSLPVELPHRNQWLRYNGDPAAMLSQINQAYKNIDWALHKDINVRRPPEPMTGGKSLAKQFQEARQLANDQKFEDAKQILRNIKSIDYGEWGADCDEWLARLNSYAALVELVEDKATFERANREWNNHTRNYGSEFDPYNIKERLRSTNFQNRKWLAGTIVVATVILVSIAVALQFLSNNADNSATQATRTEVAQLSATSAETMAVLDSTPNIPATADALDLRDTQTAQAILTQTGISFTQTPTSHPTDTPNYNASAEALRAERATSTANALITNVTPSSTQVPTTLAISTSTPTASLTSTNMVSPTSTETPSPTIAATENQISTSDTATSDLLLLASTPVTRNSNWTPVIQEFDGVEMVLVPAGCFMMGGEEGDADERPEHEQCFDTPFWIDRYEVTNEQFEAFNGEAISESFWLGNSRPRERITWYEANTFCQLRSSRLPTEREWEYAARGVDNLKYPWGNEFIDAYVVYSANADQTADVGSIPEGISWVGAYDMVGNVWEWVSSVYQPYPYDPTDGRENINSGGVRVERGGSWGYAAYSARATKRTRNFPNTLNNFIGFRCARNFSSDD